MADQPCDIDHALSEARRLFVERGKQYGDSYRHLGPIGPVLWAYSKIMRAIVVERRGVRLREAAVHVLLDCCIDGAVYLLQAWTMLKEEDGEKANEEDRSDDRSNPLA